MTLRTNIACIAVCLVAISGCVKAGSDPDQGNLQPERVTQPENNSDDETSRRQRERAEADAEMFATTAAQHLAEIGNYVASTLARIPEGAHERSCLEGLPNGLSCVPAGYFIRGVDDDEHVCTQHTQPNGGILGTGPEAEIWLDTFYVMTTEVTNEMYQSCVRNGDCTQDGPRYRDYDAPEQPITGISWYNAYRFCEINRMHLLSEAQFEKATRGPDGDLYPWGDATPTCDDAVIMDETGRACGINKRGSSPSTGRVWEVARKPAGRYGLYDIVGNAEEWVFDPWVGAYDECGVYCNEPNPTGPCYDIPSCEEYRYRVVRGGSWYWPGEHAMGYHRRAYWPSNEPAHHFGFRCAASHQQVRAMIRELGTEGTHQPMRHIAPFAVPEGVAGQSREF